MKRILLLSMAVLSLAACKKGEDPPVNNQTFSARINGAKWTANEMMWGTINDHLHIQGGLDKTVINITIPAYSNSGPYDIASGNANAGILTDGKEMIANKGVITITLKDSTRLQGSFSFEAVGNGNTVKKVESGTFSLTKH